MKISAITPTGGRSAFLPGLYESFRTQTHPDVELLVCDDSPQPDAFMSGLNDNRVHYFHSDKPLTTGEKRNYCIDRCDGSVIALFDDDDYYAPVYLQTMLDQMQDVDLVKLHAWFVLTRQGESLYYWDTSQAGEVQYYYRALADTVTPIGGLPNHPRFFSDNVEGYGFSYVFRKSLYPEVSFPASSNGEDSRFVTRLKETGRKIKYVADTTGLVLHNIHGRNTAPVYPQYRLPRFIADTLFPGLRAYLRAVGLPHD